VSDCDQGADEVAGISIDIAGSSDEEGVTISDTAEETSEAIEEIAELTADETSDETTADEDGASLDTTTAELDGSTGVTGVGVPRLKIQMRPMMTITATMMMIQVLRFMCLPFCEEDETGKFDFQVDALPPPEHAASNCSPIIGGI